MSVHIVKNLNGDEPPVDGLVIIGLKFKLDSSACFHTVDGFAADVFAIEDRVRVTLRRAKAARLELARKAQIKPAAMPIVLSIGRYSVSISVLSPMVCDQQALLEQLRPVTDDITSWWTNCFTLAARIERTCGDADSAPAAPSAASHTARDRRTKRFVKDLRAAPSIGDLTVSFISAGACDEQSTVTIPTAARDMPARKVLGDQAHPIEAFVLCVLRSGRALIRLADGTKQLEATFSTTANLSALLKYASEGPPVRLAVRDYQMRDSEDSCNPAHHIEALLPGSSKWLADPFALTHLMDSLAEFEGLIRGLGNTSEGMA